MSVTVKMVYDKSTAGTIRYREIQQPGEVLMMGTLYLRKDGARTLDGSAYPEEITVTIEAGPQGGYVPD